MNRNRVVRGILVLFLVLGVAALVGGGIVYARVRADNPSQELAKEGLLIAGVTEESPAAEAGLVRGDILLEIDGEAIVSRADLARHLLDLAPGDEVELKVLHGDDVRTLTATLDEKNGRPYLGVLPCGSLPQLLEEHLPFEMPPVDGRHFGRHFGHHFDHHFYMWPDVEGILEDVEGGVVVRQIAEDGPAAEAGLQRWDLIAALDGEALAGPDALPEALASYEPGDQVTLTVYRLEEEESLEIEAVLGEHPDQEGVAYLGVFYFPLPDLEKFDFDHGPFGRMPFGQERPFFPELEEEEMRTGALIRGVVEDSPAVAAGLEVGDVIVALDGESFQSPDELVEGIRQRAPGDRVTLTVFSQEDEQERQVTVTLGENPDQTGVAYLGVSIGGFYQGFFHGMPFGRGSFPEDAQPFRPFDQMPFGRDLFPKGRDSSRPFEHMPFGRGRQGPRWQPFRFHGRLQDFFNPDEMPEDFSFPFESFDEGPCCSGDDTA